MNLEKNVGILQICGYTMAEQTVEYWKLAICLVLGEKKDKGKKFYYLNT